MTLTDFLLARIAEDRVGAVAHAPDPRRWERECEAKCRIVTACSEVTTIDRDSVSAICAIDACRYTLRAMADVYASHPDYREEWKP